MATMNAINLLIALSLTAPATLAIAVELTISTPEGIVRAGKQKKVLKINSIGYTHRTRTGVYMGGYLRDAQGAAGATIAYVSHDLKQEKYWPMATGVAQFFTYQGKLHILDDEGKTHFEENGQWLPGQWHFPPAWKVVYSDTFLIACRAHDLAKEAAPRRNGCMAPEKNWEIAIDWAITPPAMCNNRFTVREYRHGPNATHLPFDLVQFDPETGKEIARKQGVTETRDICRVNFP